MNTAVVTLVAAAVVLVTSNVIAGRSLRLATRGVHEKRNYRWAAGALILGAVAFCASLFALYILAGSITSNEPVGASLAIVLAPFVVAGGAFLAGIAFGE